MNSLQQKVIIITGAVGNLGFAVAQAAQRYGAKVVLVDRSAERLSATYSDPTANQSRLLAGGVDLSQPESVADLVRRALERFGRIDGLVNTVGAWRGGKRVHEAALEDWSAMYDLNVRTTLLTCRAVVPTMLAQRRGSIVNVGSRAAFVADAGTVAYSAAKAAVLRLSEGLSAELKAEGINVNCVLPSTIDTPQNRAAAPTADHSKWVDPAAIADPILFLLSDAARAIHGAALPIYGLS